ncbi:hypothetical protein PIROE2DRAFT_61778 [Piromyces sp. E2]|nr:hypothetical protein PIROE2DRAFT_61778 [Piromyces sp. E2]|eukprot:OUM62628.1 hypothetical protein PIROE2DRAFT_61778 [Piromyces sp. E2]
MYYYLAPNCEPATVTNILELYEQTKSRLLQKKKAQKNGTALKSSDKMNLPPPSHGIKENALRDKENDINISNNHKNTGLGHPKTNKNSLPLSNKENLSETVLKKSNKENRGILTKSNMNAANILKPSTKGNKLKDGKTNVKTELDDNKENIPPLHHNQYNTTMNLQFVDYPSGNGTVGMTAVTKTDDISEDKENTGNKLNKVKKEEGEEDGVDDKQQKKTKSIVVNTVSDEDLEEFFRVFDDLIPMYRSSTQLQEVIFETSQKEWNEWCYKVEQCEEETHSWLDARIMFYSRRIIEYQKDWAEYWNKKRQKEKEMLELTSDLSSDGLCPNTPSSTPLLSDPIKLLGSSPLPPLSLNVASTVNTYIPFQTPDESSTSMLTSSEATPTKTTVNANSNNAFTNLLMGTEDIDLTSFSLDSNQDLLSNMSLLYDTSSNQSGYPNLDYSLDSTSSFDGLDPLGNATAINNDYCNWLSSNPSSSLSMDDILFNPATPTDPNYSLLLNSAAVTAASPMPTATSSLNFLNPLAAAAATTTSLNPALSIFDTNYTTTATDDLLIPPTSLVKLPSVSSTASLIDSFANLDPGEEDIGGGKEGGEDKANHPKEIKIKEEKEKGEGVQEDKEKMKVTVPVTSVGALADPSMTSLLTNDLGLDFLFQDGTDVKINPTTTTGNMTATTAMGAMVTKNSDETPKMTIKAVTDALITPTKPKDITNPLTIDFFVDTNGNKKTSEFATPLYIKPPSMDTFSSIPKSYQEMYNDKMYSLISTLERCVQDKEDFWKVMEEFTSSINK